MSFGRGKFSDDLRKRISEAVSEGQMNLGVEIVRVELTGCHPPKEAADAFEDVIAAERERDRMRYEAQTDANKILAEIVGSPDQAWKLASAIKFSNDLNALKQMAAKGATEAQLSAAAAAALRQTSNEVDRLNREIRRQRLMGRLNAPTTRPAGESGKGKKLPLTQALRDRQLQHAKLLAEIQRRPDPAQIDAGLAGANRYVDALFKDVGGRAAVALEQALAYRWQREFQERALADVFPVEMMLYKAAPSLYRLEKLLAVLAETLRLRKKYILAMDRKKVEVWLNLEEQAQPLPEIPLAPGE